MFARISTMRVKPGSVAEIEGRMDDVARKIQEMPGAISIYVSWRDDGAGVVSAIWESQAAAEASQDRVKEVWGGLMDLLDGPPSIEHYDQVRKLSA